MGKIFDAIPDNLIEWIKEQEVFWVSTAPLSADGHLNISPKGVRGSFVVEGSDHGVLRKLLYLRISFPNYSLFSVV